MKPLNLKTQILVIFCLVLASSFCMAQQGNLVVNQDKKITTLLDVKKEMNKNDADSDQYKIQIYSGNDRGRAEATRSEFSASFADWQPTMQYETPNFKVWAGNFNTRLEADRALRNIKRKFPSAFILKPKK